MIPLPNKTPEENISKSSVNTIQSIIYSIISLDNVSSIKPKLETLTQALKLNEIEQQIIKTVNDDITVNGKINAKYIVEKFSYWFNAQPYRMLDADLIDYAIADRRIEQDRNTIAQTLLETANNITDQTAEEIRETLNNLVSSTVITQDNEEIPENDLHHLEDAYADIYANNGKYTLVIPEVEEYAGKFAPGQIVSILASVASYKSTFAMNVAYENALDGVNVLYLSLEATGASMISKMVTKHIALTETDRNNLVNGGELLKGRLTAQQAKVYNETHNKVVDLMNNNFLLWDSTKVKFNTFYEMSKTLRQADKYFTEKTGKGLEIVVLDQLALLKYTEGSGRRTSFDGAIMDGWMKYFGEQSLNFLNSGRQIAGIIVSQVRRESFREASKPKNKGRYGTDCPGDSSEIERTSSTMITLFKDLDTRNTVLIHIPKARHGQVPDDPIQVEAWGEYSHIGPLENVLNTNVTVDDFAAKEFDLMSMLS